MRNLLLTTLTGFFLISVPVYSANLYCGGELINLDLLEAEYSGVKYEGYIEELFMSNCGIEGNTCYTGKTTSALGLVDFLNMVMYEGVDGTTIIETTLRKGRIVIKYTDTGEYDETVVNRCSGKN